MPRVKMVKRHKASVSGWNKDGDYVTEEGYGPSLDKAIAEAKRKGEITEVGDISDLGEKWIALGF